MNIALDEIRSKAPDGLLQASFMVKLLVIQQQQYSNKQGGKHAEDF